MFDDDISDLLEDDYGDLESVPFNINNIKENITKYPSQQLCEMIVCDRYLNINHNIAILAMQELALRRVNGDAFLFEDYIDSSLKSLPKIDFSIPDFNSIIKNFKK